MKKLISFLLVFGMLLTALPLAGFSAEKPEFQSAQTLILNQSFSGTITAEAPNAYYKLTLASSGQISFTVTSYLKWYSIYILGSEGEEIWKSTGNKYVDTVGMVENTHDVIIDAGVYYVKINGYKQFESNATGNYMLLATFINGDETNSEPNNIAIQASLIEVSQTINGVIAVNDSEDIYRLPLSKSGKLDIMFTSHLKWYSIYFIDEAGETIWSSTGNTYVAEAGEITNKHVVFLEAGVYYIRVNGYKQFESSATGFYQFNIKYTDAQANHAEPNDAIAEASGIRFDETVYGVIAQNDKNDFFGVTLAYPGRIDLSITSFLPWYSIYLYDINGIQLWKSEGNAYIASTQRITNHHILDLAAGKYYIRVNGYKQFESDAVGFYHFSIAFTDAEANSPEPNDSALTATPLNPNHTAIGNIAINDKADCYRISLLEEESIRITVKTQMDWYSLYLINDQGEVVWKSEGNNASEEKTFTCKALTGDGFILFNGYKQFKSDATGQYELCYQADHAIAFEPDGLLEKVPAYTPPVEKDRPHGTPSAAVAETEDNDSILKANVIGFEGLVSGEISTVDDIDHFKLALDHSGKIDISITSYLPYYSIYLYNAQGEAVWKSEGNTYQAFVGFVNRIHAVYLEAGVYYLMINSYKQFESRTTGKYSFSVRFTDALATNTETDNTAANATKTDFGKKNCGVIAVNDDCDYYKIVMDTSGRITIDMESEMPWYSLYLFDQAVKSVWKAEGQTYIDPVKRVSNEYQIYLEAGTYYLKVNGYKQFESNATGFYQFNISFTDAQANIEEPNDSIAESKLISVGKQADGVIAAKAETEDEDYFEFSVASQQTVHISVLSYLPWYSVYVYDEAGARVKSFEGNSYNSKILRIQNTHDITLEPGTYFLDINGFKQFESRAKGFYSLILSVGDTVLMPEIREFPEENKDPDAPDIPVDHEHMWDMGTVTKEATCATEGIKTFTCAVCRQTKTEQIDKDPFNHTGENEVRNAKPASCGENGYTGDTYCKSCGVKLASGTDIPKTGAHNFGEWKILKAATVAETGLKEHVCTVCGFSEKAEIAKLTDSDALLGDVDGDGKVSAADARLALRASVGLEKYGVGSVEFLAADVDHNGRITAADARLILRASVNLEELK